MTMYLLYCGLLVIWLPLLWPMVALKGAARLWLLAVIAAGVASLIYQTRIFLLSYAAMPRDVFVISIAMIALYGSVAGLLFAKGWWRAARVLVAALVVIGGGMSYEWMLAARETQRLTRIFETTNRLLIEAKFGSPKVYDRTFGPFTDTNHPTGHWRAEGESHFTRLIINSNGRVWLFYQCQEDAECDSGAGRPGYLRSYDEPRIWTAVLTPQTGAPFFIEIVQTEPGTLSVEVHGQRLIEVLGLRHQFTPAPPPIHPDPPPQSLRFLGPFVNAECKYVHRKVRQVWLWQGDTRAYAIGIFDNLSAGGRSKFVIPVVMGEGVKDGDGWRFTWRQEGRSGTALIVPADGEVILTYDLETRDVEDADKMVLAAGGVLKDERIDLAPLTNGADWRHWFETMFVGYFISGFVPRC